MLLTGFFKGLTPYITPICFTILVVVVVVLIFLLIKEHSQRLYAEGQLQEIAARPLPDIYNERHLMEQKKTIYKQLAQQYDVPENIVRTIFCKGADLYKSLIQGQRLPNEKLPATPKPKS